ncbi:MAG: Bug family tripartite tricarboxylate transporter substrate binding protein [Betaproteobacteria bacterium]
MKLNAFILRTALAGAALFTASHVLAQDYPSRDITFIVPYAPGGSTDPISRQIASQLEKELKGSVNVENKPGGSATIGVGQVIRSKPDGYTIGLSSNSALAYQPLVNKSITWKSPADYQSIVTLVKLPAIITVKADSPYKTFEDFVEAARKNPGKIRVAVSGYRTAPDLVIQELNKVANIRLATVPFTGGGGEALIALLGGRVEATSGYAPTVKAHVDAGTVRVLAAFSKDKYFMFPEAQSVVQAGYNVTLPADYGVVAPKGLPKDVLDKLVNAALKVGKSEEFAKFAASHGLVLDVGGPKVMDAEMTAYGKTFADLIAFMSKKTQQ